MTTYQAKVDHLIGRAAPDEYDPLLGGHPPPSFVVSRNADGETLSVYGEMVWDRTPYDPDGRPYKLNFQYWLDGDTTPERINRAGEIRWIMFVLIWMSPGSPLSNGGLNKYITLLRTLARAAEVRTISLKQLLADPIEIGSAINPSQAKACVALLRMLDWIGPDQTGYQVDSSAAREVVYQDIQNYSDSVRQTVPMPTRIYSETLARLNEELETFQGVSDRLIAVLKDCCVQGLPCRGDSFVALVIKHDLEAFWNRRGAEISPKSLCAMLTEAQWLASLQIQAFSGMRGDEVDTLPYHCLEEQVRYGDDRIHYIIKGKVTKEPGGARRAQWVTNNSGRSAVLFARSIASAVYKILGVKLQKSDRTINDQYLFVRATSVLIAGSQPGPIEIDLTYTAPRVREKLAVKIEQADIDELTRIDPHRHWELEDEFAVGATWLLRRHQFRRSLALYAQASGLVSLPSLKRQLQHITQEMTLYYCSGSTFAKDFIGEAGGEKRDKHFGIEWQETKAVSEGLAYIAHVLLADQADLFGPHVLWNQLHRTDGNSGILVDRDATMAAVKKGLLGYKPTPIGGCANPGPCDKVPITVLHTECIKDACKHMIGQVSKVERVIKFQRIQVDRLNKADPASFEARLESQDLQILEDCLEKAKTAGTNRRLSK